MSNEGVDDVSAPIECLRQALPRRDRGHGGRPLLHDHRVDEHPRPDGHTEHLVHQRRAHGERECGVPFGEGDILIAHQLGLLPARRVELLLLLAEGDGEAGDEGHGRAVVAPRAAGAHRLDERDCEGLIDGLRQLVDVNVLEHLRARSECVVARAD